MTQSAESQKPPDAPQPQRPPESLQELAAKQGIRPAADLDALGDRWPADDDPDALDEFIRQQRAARTAPVPHAAP